MRGSTSSWCISTAGESVSPVLGQGEDLLLLQLDTPNNIQQLIPQLTSRVIQETTGLREKRTCISLWSAASTWRNKGTDEKDHLLTFIAGN